MASKSGPIKKGRRHKPVPDAPAKGLSRTEPGRRPLAGAWQQVLPLLNTRAGDRLRLAVRLEAVLTLTRLRIVNRAESHPANSSRSPETNFWSSAPETHRGGPRQFIGGQPSQQAPAESGPNSPLGQTSTCRGVGPTADGRLTMWMRAGTFTSDNLIEVWPPAFHCRESRRKPQKESQGRQSGEATARSNRVGACAWGLAPHGPSRTQRPCPSHGEVLLWPGILVRPKVSRKTTRPPPIPLPLQVSRSLG